MSEFVECQNCGRKFFAENIECPYCRGGGEEHADEGAGGRHPSTSPLFAILFTSFMFVLAGIAVVSFISMPRSPAGSPRTLLGMEAALAVVTLVGLAQRKRWARYLAIAFILGNALIGLVALVDRGQGRSLAWGPGPAAMLLFLLPFLSPQARDRFSR